MDAVAPSVYAMAYFSEYRRDPVLLPESFCVPLRRRAIAVSPEPVIRCIRLSLKKTSSTLFYEAVPTLGHDRHPLQDESETPSEIEENSHIDGIIPLFSFLSSCNGQPGEGEIRVNWWICRTARHGGSDRCSDGS